MATKKLTFDDLADVIAEQAGVEIVDRPAFMQALMEAAAHVVKPHLYMKEKEIKGIVKKVTNEQPASGTDSPDPDQPADA